MKGRKPIPASIKKLSGDGIHDSGGRLILPPITAPGGMPEAPTLDRYGKKEWERLTGELTELGVLFTTDRAALWLYMEHWQLKQQAFAALQGRLTVENNDGKTINKNPAFVIYREAADYCTKLLQEFGLTPVSRERLKQSPKIEKDELEIR